MRHFRLLIALLFLPAFAQGQTVVSGHVKMPDTSAPANAKLCFTLLNYKPNVPKVIGTGAIVGTTNFCITPAADGSYTSNLFGNNLITPAATNWRVDFLLNGIQVSSATYLITHSPFNLDTEVPLTSSTPAGPNQLVLNVFPFTQLTPATTWTIPHNFNDANTIALLAGLNGNDIFPDTKNCRTDLNNCVVTFVTPTAGFAVVVHAAAINIATSQPNAIISNSTAPQTVQQPFTVSGNLTATAGQNLFRAYNIDNILMIDGQKYANPTAALADCGTACVIDARGGLGSLALGTFDPGNASVTLLLGAYNYTANQIILRTNTHILGAGVGTGLGGLQPGTVIQSIGSNSTPLMVLGNQSFAAPSQDVILSGLNLIGAVANTSQNGIYLNTSSPSAGLWNSLFEDIVIQGFAGIGLNLEAGVTSPQGIHQIDTFRRVIVFRTNGGSYALQIKGFNNSLKFENDQFDGGTGPFGGNGGDGLTNINIQDVSGIPFPPYDIKFDLLTTQWAGVAVQINGCDAVSFDQLHLEGDFGGVQIGDGATFHSMGVSVNNSWSGNGSGAHGGNGFIFNQTTANTDLSVINFHAFGVPDIMFKGTVVNTPSWGIFNSTNQIPLPPAFGSPSGFGAGSAGTAVTTTTLGAGTGPAAPQTIVKYQQVQVNGAIYWVPLFQ